MLAMSQRIRRCGRGILSQQLAPRHQTLKRHDDVVGSAMETTMTMPIQKRMRRLSRPAPGWCCRAF
jgi:hypothetical protein